jgi:hypothetical protein
VYVSDGTASHCKSRYHLYELASVLQMLQENECSHLLVMAKYWMHLAEDRDLWQAVVNTVLNHMVS